jgi:LacI family transcriptional regulator
MSTTSIKDVAARAGVSVGTVSNVLNSPERVSDEMIRRVNTAIVDLHYVRNDAARQLRAGQSLTIGLVVLDVRNPFFTDVARGAEDRADAEGLTVMLGNSDESVARETRYLDLFEQQRVLGVLISPIGDVTERLTQLRGRGIPAVLVDRTSEDGTVSSVSVDDIAGGRMAVEHLIAQGRTRIAYLGGPLAIRQASDRYEGARQAARDHGAELELIELSAMSVLEGRAAGSAIMRRAPADRPDAIFAVNDLVSVGALQAFTVQGSTLRIPQDIAIVGYDDIDFASAAVVPLSSVRQPSALIGATALDILLEEAADPRRQTRRIEFMPELVVRASSGA